MTEEELLDKRWHETVRRHIFPEEAKAQYRKHWGLLAEAHRKEDEDASDEASERMGYFEHFLCRRPGPEWDAFRKTLPGYEYFWRTLVEI